MIAGLIALFFWVIISSVTPSIVKLALKDVPPFTLILFRYLIAIIVIFPIYWKQRPKHISRAVLWELLLIGSLGTAFNSGIYAYGLQYTSTIMAQVLYATTPLLVGLLSVMFLKEKINKYQVVGVLVGLAGILFLFYESVGQQNLLTLGTPVGNIIILVSVAVWSIYTIFSKKFSKTHSPITISFYGFLGGAIILCGASPVELFMTGFPTVTFSLPLLFDVLYLGSISSVLIYYLYQYGLQKTSAFTASLVFFLSPLAVAFFSTILVGEHITPAIFIGGSLTLAGVFIAIIFGPLKRKMRSMVQ